MSESKIQIQQRKIRNGIRKEKEAREELMWEKLSSTYVKKITFDDIVMSSAVRNANRRIYHMPANQKDIRGQKFDQVIIDEWMTKND